LLSQKKYRLSANGVDLIQPFTPVAVSFIPAAADRESGRKSVWSGASRRAS
jgi:hypothetical protein